MRIIGAGLAGLLAANMLNRQQPQVFEAQPELPNNHSAVLRFGSTKVADALGISFRKVRLIKTYLPHKNRVADNLSYSFKCSGVYRSDRSIASDVFSADRWIAPTDLIQRMAEGVNITFSRKLDRAADFMAAHGFRGGEPTISTMPMPQLMKVLHYPSIPEFRYVHGANLRARIPHCDAFVSLYIPDPVRRFNRLSITGDELIAEYAFPDNEKHDLNLMEEVAEIESILGVEIDVNAATITPQKYAKIQPIDDGERKRFLAWATDTFNVFSLGRYATWRPGLQLDDLVQDIQLISGWMKKEHNYDVRRAR